MRSQNQRWRLFDDTSAGVDRFGLLLLISGLAVIAMSLVDLNGALDDLRAQLGLMFVTLAVGATLLLSLRASGVRRRLVMMTDIVVGIGVLATIALVLVGIHAAGPAELSHRATPPIAWVVLAPIAPAIVVHRLIQHRRVTRQTLFGAVSAYLLIAIAFNFAFLTLDGYRSTAFFGSEEPTTSFMYYSLVTITTLGFGDLSAVEPVGRLLSTVEAVIGQVYLVTFVAMVVGLFVGQRQSTEPQV